MQRLLQDLRYGWRMLRRTPGFTAVAVLSLSLGIGANTALFSLIDAVLLKMLPVTRPQDLVLFHWAGDQLSGRMATSIDGSISTDPKTGIRSSTSFSYLAFERMRADNQTLSDIFAFAPLDQLNVNVDGQSEVAHAQLVSGGYYTGLGVKAFRGRTIEASDDAKNASPVVVLTHSYWRRRFGLDPGAIGRTIKINNIAFTIVGVTPPGFLGALQVGESADVSIPLSIEPQIVQRASNLEISSSWWLRIMGRLRPGMSGSQAAASLEGKFQQSAIDGWLAAQVREPNEAGLREHRNPPRLQLTSGGQGLTELRASYSRPLLILLVVAGLVLLLGCTNVASLLLARATSRRKETAVRLALGASRARLVRQLLTESVLLAMIGGAGGVLVAYWGKDLLLALRPWGGDALAVDLKVDIRVLAFTALVSLITGILFGLVPALRSTRVALMSSLKDGTKATTRGAHSWSIKGFIIAQVAISVILLIGAGLFLRTLQNLENVNLGFNQEKLLIFRVNPSLNGYQGAQLASLYDRLLERLGAVPGITSVTLSRHPLLSGSRRTSSIVIVGQAPRGDDAPAYLNVVGTSFFETMEIPIKLGRGFTKHDDSHAPAVALVNQAMTRKYFGSESPIGRKFSYRRNGSPIEIVGVVGDAKYSEVRSETPATIYTSYLQEIPGQVTFAARTRGDALEMTGAVRRATQEIDSNLPLFDVKTQTAQAAESVAPERLFARLSSACGALALLITAIGLYGVMSYAVLRRTNEIGVRMALGAKPGRVMRMVLGETLSLLIVGLAIGIPAAIGVTRGVSTMLYGLKPADPISIAFAVLLMIIVALFAGLVPARRASRVNPIEALREE